MRGEISVEFTFDAGHRIVGHKGKCARLHGHTYKIHVMLAGPVKGPGFVVDFGDVKDLVNEWDHRLLLWDKDPFFISKNVPTTILPGEPTDKTRTVHLTPSESGIVRLPFNPTAEHMAAYLADKIKAEFSLDAVMVELWETPKSMARYISDEATMRAFTELLHD